VQVPAEYKDALARKYPESITIAIAKDARGKHNPISLGWFMNTSHEPPMFAISIGLTRHSLSALCEAGEFVLAFVSTTMTEDMLFHGTQSGRDMDKLAEAGTKTQPATMIDSVLLSDAVANFECKVESEHPTGDHVIFVGRVVASHTNKDPSVRGLYTLGNESFDGVVPG